MSESEECVEQKYVPHIFLFSVGFIICFILLFASVNIMSAVTVYVATDGSGDYNCDGVDDHVEINEAIDYINSIGGGIVHLKNGTYLISDAIIVHSNTILEGENKNSTIVKLEANTDELINLIENANRTNPGNTNVTLGNFAIDANKYNQTVPGGSGYHDCIDFRYINNCTISGMKLLSTKNDGIKLSAAYDCKIIDNELYDIHHSAIRFSGDRNIVSNNYVTRWVEPGVGFNVDGLRIYCGSNNTVSNNTFIDCGYGIQMQSYSYAHSNDNLIKDNFFHSRGDDNSIETIIAYSVTGEEGGARNIFLRNILYNHDNNPHITLKKTRDTEIINCVIYGTKRGEAHGINVVDPLEGNVVKNSIIVNCNGYGINCVNCGSNLTLSYNNFWNNNLGNYNGTSTGTGDISVDPFFTDPANRDFHLKSEAGRWNGAAWVYDSVTSPCIDAGGPNSSYSNEPSPNGGRINMGAYGNTIYASKSIGSTGIIDVQNITVSPNPHIKGESLTEKISFANLPKEVTIRIYTVAGELVKPIIHKDTADGGSKEWDISEIASGVYIYCIESQEGKKKGKVSIIK